MRDFKNRPAVKVCGVTSVRDALWCGGEDVDLIGLNFSPASARCISRETAAEIVSKGRAKFAAMKFVGIFVNQDLDFVKTLARDLALDAVQLHGDETPEYLRMLSGTFVIKALRVGPAFTSAAADVYSCDAILLDSFSETARGGTGETFPWAAAAALRPQVRRLFLAGGLTSENVAAAMRTVRPFAVDVCSGVEAAPGVKDRDKLRRFVAAVHGAEKLEPAR